MRFSIVMTCCLFLASFSLHASPCTLTVNAVITEGCRQAGFVQVEVLVKSESANSEGFNVFADGILVSGSPFKYDVSGNTTLRVFLSCVLPMHQIFVHDMNDVACTGITPIECPDCSRMRESHRDWLPAQVYQHNSQIEPSVDVLEVSVVQPLMLFPNPVSSDDPIISLLGIAEEDYGKMGTLFVHSINDGVIVSDEINCEEQIAFNIMDDLPGGIYVIILRTERNTYSGKLIMR